MEHVRGTMKEYDWRLRTPLVDLLGCELPILCAGMGGVARFELAAAVSEAGGLGCLGMVREDPEFIRDQVQRVRMQTNAPFSINIIPAATELALLEEQIACILELHVQNVCLFWDVMPDIIRRFKNAGLLVMHQIGSVAAASQALKAGADVLIAQGIEAGGHVMGTTGSLALTAETVAMSPAPVVAAGGIATGRGVAAALSLGAQGVWCGSAFLATHESYAHDYHKRRLVEARADDTLYTRTFHINWPDHAPVRVLKNSVTSKPESADQSTDALTVIGEQDGKPVYLYSTDSPLKGATGNLEQMALYAGEGSGQIHEICSAAERVEQLTSQACQTFDQWQPSPESPPEYGIENIEVSSSPCSLAEVNEEYMGFSKPTDAADRLRRIAREITACLRLCAHAVKPDSSLTDARACYGQHRQGARALGAIQNGLRTLDQLSRAASGSGKERTTNQESVVAETHDWRTIIGRMEAELPGMHPTGAHYIRLATDHLQSIDIQIKQENE